MALAARLPVHPYRDGLLVDSRFDGKQAQMIFDTGSYTSVLTLGAVRRLGLSRMHDEGVDGVFGSVSGIGGSRGIIAVTAKTVQLGQLHARNFNFIAADVVKPPADGLLSADLLSKFDIDIDLPEEELRLYQPQGDCSHPAAFLASPMYAVPLRPFGEDRRPRITVSIGGQDFIAVVDTGASHSAIYRRAAARLGISDADLAHDKRFKISGVGPDAVQAAEHVFPAMDVGPITVNRMPVDVLNDHGGDEVEILLGADFLRRVHLWISYSSGMLIMQYPPRPSKAL